MKLYVIAMGLRRCFMKFILEDFQVNLRSKLPKLMVPSTKARDTLVKPLFGILLLTLFSLDHSCATVQSSAGCDYEPDPLFVCKSPPCFRRCFTINPEIKCGYKDNEHCWQVWELLCIDKTQYLCDNRNPSKICCRAVDF
ncbi:MAG: hypothetical protein HQK89_15560 [Nitrospirae bacterium]|nr:hypothetical protein [Nitrospirota bacterium]